MLKFVKHHMETIDGISIYPIISFLIFFTFFIGLTIYVIGAKKSHIQEMKQLPLDESETSNESPS